MAKNQETGDWREKTNSQGQASALLDGIKVPVKTLDLVEENPELAASAHKGSRT